MEILVFHSDTAKLNIVTLCLESQFNFEVRAISNFGDAIQYLLEQKNVDLIVAGETEQLPILLKYLLSVGATIPVILIDPSTDKKKSNTELSGVNVIGQLKDADVPNVLPAIIRSNYETLMAKSSKAEQPFCRINVEMLCDVTPLTGDVYVRLSSIKFVKIFGAGTVFTQKDLSRFWGVNKVDYLYVMKASAPEFINRLQNRLTGIAESAIEGDESLLSTVAQVHEIVQDLTLKVGFTEPVMELARTQVKLTLKALGKFPRLSRIFEGSLLQNANYTSRHSLMIAHLACAIASKMDWHSDSTFQKLIIAAFLHDITLAKPEYAMVQTRADLKNAKATLSPAEYKAIETHPFEASQIVDKLLEIPGDIYLVVLQHHERPDGSGFPHSLRAGAIAPLAAIFITAHELVDAYIEQGDAFDMAKFWETRGDSYSTGTFKKIAKCFRDAGKVAA